MGYCKSCNGGWTLNIKDSEHAKEGLTQGENLRMIKVKAVSKHAKEAL